MLSIQGDEEAETVVKKSQRTRGRKKEFFLNTQDAEKFNFKDLYYISDIKDELNRITTADHVKKLAGTKIWEYLVSLDLVEERNVDGRFIKVQTDKGLEMGIQTIEKVSQAGNPYTLLMYPSEVQKMIVEYYVGAREEDCEV